MNQGLQRFSLEARLRAEGVEPDTVDLAALLDPTLSYTENLRSVGEALGFSLEALDLPSYREEAEEQRFEWSVEEAVRRYLAPEASPPEGGRQEVKHE